MLGRAQKGGAQTRRERKKTRFEIVTCVVDLAEGLARSRTVYEGTKQDALKDMLKALKAAAKIYDSSGEALQMHLEDQMPESAEKSTSYESQTGEEWAGLVHERTATKISFSENAPTDDQRPYAFGRLLDVALAAVQQAKERPINPMIAHLQKMGAPMDRAFKLAVWKLLEIFERDMGVRPTVHVNPNSKVRDAGTEKYAKSIYGSRA